MSRASEQASERERERGRPVCRLAGCNTPIIYPSACTWSMTVHKTLLPVCPGGAHRWSRIKIFDLLLFGSVMGRVVFVLLHGGRVFISAWRLNFGRRRVGVLFITTRDAGNSIWINLGWLGAGITFQLMPLRGAKKKKKREWEARNVAAGKLLLCASAPRSPPAQFWCRLHQTEMLIAKPVFAHGSHRQNHQLGREHLICESRFVSEFFISSPVGK